MLTSLVFLMLLGGPDNIARPATSVVVAESDVESAQITAFGIQPLELRLGESAGGFPSWSERVIHQWINRARVDPQAELRGCGSRCGEASCYQPIAPLSFSDALNRSARFHADAMTRQEFFAHDSVCPVVANINALYPVGCDGAASCACVAGKIGCAAQGCTSWSTRVSLFGARATGEIIASTTDPIQSFYLWLWEPAPAGCGFTFQNGHRWVMLSLNGSVGIGVSGNSVGDFGNGPALAKIPSGSHYPRQGASVEIWANWYDAAPPRFASVVVDGRCIPMTLARGTGTNGAWLATVTGVSTGCHRYYFRFIDASGREFTYPATGSLGIGPTSCADWNSSRQASSECTPTVKRRRPVRRR